MNIRKADWTTDFALIAGIDDSFTTDKIYEVRKNGWSFQLVEGDVSPPLHKTFPPLSEDADRLDAIPCKLVAQDDGRVVGFAGIDLTWNGWGRVWNLRVDVDSRRKGVGQALMSGLSDWALEAGAVGIWLETQNVNFPAIHFYRKIGFELCGLDETLYSKWGDEVALYFARKF